MIDLNVVTMRPLLKFTPPPKKKSEVLIRIFRNLETKKGEISFYFYFIHFRANLLFLKVRTIERNFLRRFD